MSRTYGTVYGYDGLGYTMGDRIELHPGTDLWMRGARFGTVVGWSLTPGDRVRVQIDKIPGCKFSAPADRFRRINDEPNVDMFGDSPGALSEIPSTP